MIGRDRAAARICQSPRFRPRKEKPRKARPDAVDALAARLFALMPAPKEPAGSFAAGFNDRL
jgi:hypothetical protein